MPHQYGKRYRELATQVEKQRLYDPQEAVKLVRETSPARFDATVEAHIRLGVDPRHADQMVRSSALLPHGTGRTRRIAVFATGEKVREALDAGAPRILLDNMSPEEVREAVELASGRAELEASGGVSLATVRAYAETGVDFVSVGALTHSARSLHVSLEVR